MQYLVANSWGARMLFWKWDLLEAGHAAGKYFGVGSPRDCLGHVLPTFFFALLHSWSPPDSCCIAGVTCEGVTWCSPYAEDVAAVWLWHCFLFIIPDMLCVCMSVFRVYCWPSEKSGLNCQNLYAAALRSDPCFLCAPKWSCHCGCFWDRSFNSWWESPNCLEGINAFIPVLSSLPLQELIMTLLKLQLSAEMLLHTGWFGWRVSS